MENVLHIVGLLLSLGVLVHLAFPSLIIPDGARARSKRVGSTYWGVYEGSPADEPESTRVIELKEPIGKEKVVAGSQMYAAGRGTSFRQ